MYKTLVVPAVDASSVRSGLATAIPISETFQAKICVVFLAEVPENLSNVILSDGADAKNHFDAIDRSLENAQSKATGAEAEFEQVIQERGVNQVPTVDFGPSPAASWECAFISDLCEFARKGNAYDLVICGRADGKQLRLMRRLIHAYLSYSGRPLIVAPNQAILSIGSNVTIFWDQSPQASRSVQLALPFLKRAKEVTVTLVDTPDGNTEESISILKFLKGHDIDAHIVGAAHDKLSHCAHKFDRIGNLEDGLFVAGTSETVLSSIFWKREIMALENSELPIFISK